MGATLSPVKVADRWWASAPLTSRIGKLNAANSDKFVAGGYDLTAPNLQAVKDGHAT